jgi:hypothetical protein
MSPWGGDFAYGHGTGAVGAVGSYYYANKPYPQKSMVEDALKEVLRCIPLAKHGAHGWSKKDAKELESIASSLIHFLAVDYR